MIDKDFSNFDSSEFFNTKKKIYPNGKSVIFYSNRSIFHSPVETSDDDFDGDFQNSDFSDDLNIDFSDEKLDDILDVLSSSSDVNISRSVKRAKDRIFDIAFCNDWKYFITLTIDKSQFDSSDPSAVMSKSSTFLRHSVERFDLKYLIVPEYHTSGAIHLHGLINNALKVVDSGTRLVRGYNKPLKLSTIEKLHLQNDVQKIVYNLPQWNFGFTTAVSIHGDGGALASYFTKYMTKNSVKIFGKYYWSSKGLVREPKIEYSNSDFTEIDLPTFQVPNTSILMKYDTVVNFTK